MRLFGLHIVTDRDLTAMVRDGAASLAERRTSQILKRWAGNEACLSAAFAARNGLNARHVFLADGVLDNEARAITAFADAMGRERGEAAP